MQKNKYRKLGKRIRESVLVGSASITLLAFGLGATSIASANDYENGAADSLVVTDSGEYLAIESWFSKQLAKYVGGPDKVKGGTVYVGRYCPGDEPLGDPAGKIAVIDRGTCAFIQKVLRAEADDAIGVIVVNLPGLNERVKMIAAVDQNNNAIPRINPPITGIPAVFVGYDVGSALAANTGNVVIHAKPFNILKDAVDGVTSTLTDEEKIALKDLVAQADQLVSKKNADFDSYGEAIFVLQDFRDQIESYFFAGTIPSFDEAIFLFEAAGFLQTQIDEFSPAP